MSENEICHLSVWFSGHVQGVGFRYTVRQVAKQFEVCGTVENLNDGRVELHAEGTDKECDAFVQEICTQMEHFIRNTDVSREHRTPTFSGFQIV